MASPAYASRPGGDEIKLSAAPQIFALKYVTGKDVLSKFPGGRVMFSAIDGRKLFLNDEDANEFEHGLADQQIRPGELIAASRVSHGRGGGFAIRVERVPDTAVDDAPGWVTRAGAGERTQQAPPSRIEAQLEKSVEIARRHGAQAFVTPQAAENRGTAASPESAAPTPGRQQQPNDSAPASAKGTMSGLLAGALCASIDAYAIATEYAASKGLPLTFAPEDVRTSANSMLIEYWRSGGTR